MLCSFAFQDYNLIFCGRTRASQIAPIIHPQEITIGNRKKIPRILSAVIR